MSSSLILPLPTSWTLSGNYDLLNNVCASGESERADRGIALYENGTARHESIHASRLWMYYVDSSQGDAEIILSVLDQLIRHVFLSTLLSSPYAGCERKVLIAEGLNPRIDMALDIRGRFRPGATGLSPSARAFTFTNIEYIDDDDADDSDLVPSSVTTTQFTTSSGTPSLSSSEVPTVETPSVPSASSDHRPEASSTHAGSRTPLIIGLAAAGGFLAMAALLVALVRLRSRRNRRARRSQAGMSASSDWTEYSMQARSSASQTNGARGSAFMAVPTQDPDVDERDAVLFDASIAAQSMALYDAIGSSDGTRSPLLPKSEKQEQKKDQVDAGPGPSAQSSVPTASYLNAVPAVQRSTTRATAWDEPPPEYSI